MTEKNHKQSRTVFGPGGGGVGRKPSLLDRGLQPPEQGNGDVHDHQVGHDIGRHKSIVLARVLGTVVACIRVHLPQPVDGPAVQRDGEQRGHVRSHDDERGPADESLFRQRLGQPHKEEQHDALETPNQANVHVPRRKQPLGALGVGFVLGWREREGDFVRHACNGSFLRCTDTRSALLPWQI